MKFVLLVWLALGITPLGATPLTPVDLTDTRNSGPGGGLAASMDWDNGGFTFSWNIAPTGSGWNYEYHILAHRKDISHILLETSPGFDYGVDAQNLQGASLEAPPPGGWTEQQGNPQLPVASLGGMKLAPTGDAQDWSFSFNSPRAPTWGSFYAKDGRTSSQDVTAWNRGLASPSTAAMDYVAVPDTQTVPEASTLLLWGLGLAGIGRGFRRKPR